MNARKKVLPGLLRSAEAAAYCGVSLATWERWTASGLNPSGRKVGGAVLWSRHELAAWGMRGCPPRDQWVKIWAVLMSRR